MNIKTHPINPVTTGMQRKPFRFFVISSAVAIASLSLVHGFNTLEANKAAQTSITAPSTYTLQALAITSPTSGTAVITLDDFILNVGFDFEAVPDNYGPIGSEFTNVAVSNLAIEKIVGTSGTEFRDFTDHTDHQQINAMIVGYILQHRLVEGI